MSDDKTNRGQPDRSKTNMSEDYEVQYWGGGEDFSRRVHFAFNLDNSVAANSWRLTLGYLNEGDAGPIAMFDIFISFKNLDGLGKPSRDSALAREVFEALSGRGYRVFFSPVSLEKLGVSAYKAAIDKALDCSRIMIAVGTSGGNLDTQWVRYEWDGFFNDILSGAKPEGRVFVFVDDVNPRELPRALRQSQVFVRNDGGLEKLINFVANALSGVQLSSDTRSPFAGLLETPGAVDEAPVPTNPAARPHYESHLTKRYGDGAVALVGAYPFLKKHWAFCDQERIFRPTGRRSASGDREVSCRICGNRQEFDRYPSLELPRTCPNCGFEGDFSARIFFGYARDDHPLAQVIIKELQLAQFRLKQSGIAWTIGGSLDRDRLKAELALCKASVWLWSNKSASDEALSKELGVARDMGLPALFIKVEGADPEPRRDTESVLDFNGPAYWDALLLNELCDCLAVDERRRRDLAEDAKAG
jgi:hypothetical protein